jgi:hypothetical protein
VAGYASGLRPWQAGTALCPAVFENQLEELPKRESFAHHPVSPWALHEPVLRHLSGICSRALKTSRVFFAPRTINIETMGLTGM